MRNTAVLIIDMQPNYMLAVEPQELEQLLNAQRLLLEYCTRNDILTIAIEMAGKPATDQRFRALLNATRSYTRQKPSRDAFSNAAITDVLEEHGIERLILSGLFTSECVLATAESAVDAHRKSYSVWTSPALMADGDLPQAISTQGSIIVPQYDVHKWYAKNTHYHPDVASLLRAQD